MAGVMLLTGGAGLFENLVAVAEGADLLRAARGVVGRVEEEDDLRRMKTVRKSELVSASDHCAGCCREVVVVTFFWRAPSRAESSA